MTTIVTRTTVGSNTGKGSPLTHTEVDTNFVNLNTAKLETAAIPLGTLQAPSISFLNDSDTGIFCPQGGNSLAIVTGGQYAITCSSTQAVGIKTANPQGALQVAGSTRIGANDATDAFLEIGEGATGNRNSYIDIVADTTYTDYGLRIIRNNTGANATSELKHRGTGALNFTTQEAAPIVFNTTNSPRLTITSGGLVGIGTNPSSLLHLSGSASFLTLNATTANSNNIIFQVSSSTKAYIGLAGNLGGSDNDLGFRAESGNNQVFYIGSGEKARIRSDGMFEVKGAGVSGSSPAFSVSGSAPANSAIIDTSGRLLIGTASAFGGSKTEINSGTDTSAIRITDANYDGSGSTFLYPVAAYYARTDGVVRSANPLAAGGATAAIVFTDEPGNATYVENLRSSSIRFYTGANNVPSFTNVTPTERMRIKSDGNVNLGGGTTGSYRLVVRTPNTTESTGSLLIENSSALGSVYCFNVSGTGVSVTDAAMWIQKNSSTNRSINAAGTVNASGADYAEYMIKAGDFTIAKGDVCGVTADGQLTTEFADAVSFVVKSTNPSYVGGDTWGNAEVIGERPEDDADALAQWEADLEAARQLVDRIAFAGQVPVNVMGATPGQYIVPIEAADGGIEGVAKNEADLTLAEYMRAVGKVIAIEDDGRARIIVKVA